MKKLLVVGYGYVGKAMVEFLKNHYEVDVYDPLLFGDENAENILAFKRRVKGTKVKRVENYTDKFYDLAIVCVPTPMADDKSCQTDYVEEVVSKADADVILIKSTVKPNTTNILSNKYNKKIVFSPEYIGEGTYWTPYKFHVDMKETPFYIFGGDDISCNKCIDIFVPVAGPKKIYYKCSSLDAEMIKYMENTYFGIKVTFAQEMYEICKTIGADWYRVWQGWAFDPRVDIMHMAVFPDKRGFGGKCLPKDLNALVRASEDAGYEPKFLKQMLASNDYFNSLNEKT